MTKPAFQAALQVVASGKELQRVAGRRETLLKVHRDLGEKSAVAPFLPLCPLLRAGLAAVGEGELNTCAFTVCRKKVYS